jgi:sigma-B regulation protein RsbQ
MRSLFRSLLLSSFAFGLSVVTLPAASVDGVKIHSSITGKGPKTVIFVHGWTCDETSWNAQIPVVSQNYRVVTLDLPGHGQTPTPKNGLSMDLFARAVEAVRKESKADRVVVVGHSMGTPVAITYARLYPQHVIALVFVDGGVNLRKGGPLPDPKTMGGPDGLKTRETVIRSMFSASTTPDEQKHILSMMLAAPESTAVGAMAATFNPAAWTDDVFEEPVLGIYADHSRAADRDYIKTHFPNFQYEEVAGSGHFVMIDKPEEFNRLLIGFLGQQKF